MVTSAPAAPDAGVLVRIAASGPRWPQLLPAVPDGYELTVTLGSSRLLPAGPLPVGLRLVGVATDHRPIGDVVDVLVPASLRASEPVWTRRLCRQAERVFDLRFGPVAQLLAAELALHRSAG